LDFAKVMAEVSRFLDGEGVRWGVAGGIALNAHGLARLTTDLDLVVDESVRGALIGHLEALGYEALRVTEGYSNHLHRDALWGRLDFIYLDAHTADLLFARSRRLRPLGDLEVLVPSPEHLIAMKLLAIKNQPSRTFQDLADVQFLLGLPGVDEAEVRGYFVKHGFAERLDELRRILAGP